MCQITNGMLGFWSHVCSWYMMKDSERVFIWYLIGCPGWCRRDQGTGDLDLKWDARWKHWSKHDTAYIQDDYVFQCFFCLRRWRKKRGLKAKLHPLGSEGTCLKPPSPGVFAAPLRHAKNRDLWYLGIHVSRHLQAEASIQAAVTPAACWLAPNSHSVFDRPAICSSTWFPSHDPRSAMRLPGQTSDMKAQPPECNGGVLTWSNWPPQSPKMGTNWLTLPSLEGKGVRRHTTTYSTPSSSNFFVWMWRKKEAKKPYSTPKGTPNTARGP